MNIQINKQLINDQIPTNMSGDQISVLFSEKQEREGLNIDYRYLKTGEVLEMIAHYVSNQMIPFFEILATDMENLYESYPLTEAFTEPKLQREEFERQSILKASF